MIVVPSPYTKQSLNKLNYVFTRTYDFDFTLLTHGDKCI